MWKSSNRHALHQLCPLPLTVAVRYSSAHLCVSLRWTIGWQTGGFEVSDLCWVRSKLWYFHSEAALPWKTTESTPVSQITYTHKHTHIYAHKCRSRDTWLDTILVNQQNQHKLRINDKSLFWYSLNEEGNFKV